MPAVATTLPTWVDPSSSLTVDPISAVPVYVAVVSLVIPSVVEMPVSLAAVRKGGEAGAVVSL